MWLNLLLDPGHGLGASCSARSFVSTDFEDSASTYISNIEDHLICFADVKR